MPRRDLGLADGAGAADEVSDGLYIPHGGRILAEQARERGVSLAAMLAEIAADRRRGEVWLVALGAERPRTDPRARPQVDPRIGIASPRKVAVGNERRLVLLAGGQGQGGEALARPADKIPTWS
ncbi:MAG: hypothetical protein ACYDAQ_05530 [Mycobacteriales bacterium]